METKLTVPISADNLEDAKEQIKAAKYAGAEMLELRTDYLEGLSVDLVRQLIGDAKGIAELPIIVTCRDKSQGGAKKHPLQLRLDVLVAAAEAGAEFVDFEYENFLVTENRERIERLPAGSKSRLIISAHNFNGRFENIGRLCRDIETLYPAAIPKLVYTAEHINDCFEAFDLLNKKRGDAIIFCMGAAGLVSRIIAKKLGSVVTFASIDEQSATAPGQLTIKNFKELYRYDDIKPDTQLYGVIADPVGHSLSPNIHNACFAAADMNKLYLPLWLEGKSEQFDEFMDHIISRKYLDFAGLSITIPHKANALEYTKSRFGFVEPLAEKIGAANTLIIGRPRATSDESRVTSDERRICACNTDYAGALDAVTGAIGINREGLKNMPTAVLGAGGVARAIVAGLTDVGAKIKIYNRTVKKAEKLAGEFNCDFAGLDELKTLDAKLIINCTSIGMKKTEDRRQKTEEQMPKAGHERRATRHETPVPAEFLKEDMYVFDMVYNPPETLLLKQAKKIGAKTITGLDMFVNQAAAQFKLFTNQIPDTNLMQQTILEELKKLSD